MNLEHSFRYTCKDWAAMLNGVNTIKALVANIQQCAIASVPLIFDDNTRAALANKYTGDAFEVFCEYFIKSHGASSEVGITDYRPLKRLGCTDKDTGADGLGIGTNLKPAAVQIKFKSNPTQVLAANEDHLTNLTTAAWGRYRVDVNDTQNLLIITTGKELATFTRDEMLQGKVRCLGYKELCKMLDNNLAFWEGFRMAVAPIDPAVYI